MSHLPVTVSTGVQRTAAPQDRTWLPAFILTAPFVPGLVAMVTIILYLIMPDTSAVWAVMFGTATGLLVWMFIAFCSRPFVMVAQARPAVYHHLETAYAELKAVLDALSEHKDTRAYCEAQTHIALIAKALGTGEPVDATSYGGLDWFTGVGYTSVWSHVHRAEEALVELADPTILQGILLYEQRRITGSTISNREDLLEEIRHVQQLLQAPSAKPPTTTSPAPTDPAQQADPEDVRLAQVKLRAVSQVVNEFRDDRWEALARARNRLHKTGIYTGIVSYALLSIVLVQGGAIKPQVFGAAMFFLVGAIAGLFSRLLAEAKSNYAVEDYGLSSARVLQTPLFAGLAAVGGVVLMTLMPSGQDKLPTLSLLNLLATFDLMQNPFGLVIAAVFGLTPHLLIDRLQAETDKYKLDLAKSKASDND